MSPTRRIVLAVAALTLVLAAAGSASADWPQFRHDDEHTGVGDQPGVVKTPYEPWTFSADGPVVSSPAVTTVDGERVAVFGSYPGQGTPGTLYAVDADGNEVWSSQPVDTGGGYIASPTVEDVDGDGGKEVVAATLDDATLRVFDAATGSQEWSTQVGASGEDLLASSPVLADVDGDGDEEIVVGGSADDQTGTIFVYETDGTRAQALELDGPAWSTPLVADGDGDGTREVYLATGVPDQLQQLFPNAKTGGRSLYAFETGQGGLAVDWNVTLDGPTIASPAMGDADGDDGLEVVVGDRPGTLWAVDAATGGVDAYGDGVVGPLAALSSPVVTDLTGDGAPEVALGNYRGIHAFNLTDAGTWEKEAEVKLPPVEGADPWMGASPAVQDVDGDGAADVVGMTVPILVDDQNVLDSDAYPGTVFAVDGSALDAGGATLNVSDVALWTVDLPDDGGLGGPVLADLDADGDSEVMAGEGVPLIGNGSTVHLVDAANPTVDAIEADPAEPTDLDQVDLTAAVRDEDGDVSDLSYRWELGDGNVSEATSPTHGYADDGTYPVNVTVTDPDGHTWTATRDLVVRNVPPSLDPVAEVRDDDLNVTLHAGASDPDGSVVSVDWTLGDGTAASGETVDHEYPTGGTYKVNVTATDEDGDATTASFDVSVNRWPSVDGPENATVQENETLTWNLTWDDPDGDALADVTVANASGAEATWNDTHVQVTWTPPYDVANRSNTPVLRRVDVTVHDAATPQGNATDPYNVTVENVNRAPEVGDPDTTTVVGGVPTDVEGSLVDPDGNDLALNGSGLPPNSTLSQEADTWVLSVDHEPVDSPVTYDVNVTADDGLDNDTTSFTLTVEPNEPPAPAADVTPAIVNASTRWNATTATLDATGTTDPEGDDLVRHEWFHPTGATRGEVVEVPFPEGGTHDVLLEVEDARGAVGSLSVPVPVDDALTGGVVVVPDGSDVTGSQEVRLQVERASGVAVGGADVTVTLEHVGYPVLRSQKETTTSADGSATVRFQGDAGTPAFLPGEHRVIVEAAAGSADGAILQDQEHVRMTRTFLVDASTGPIVDL